MTGGAGCQGEGGRRRPAGPAWLLGRGVAPWAGAQREKGRGVEAGPATEMGRKRGREGKEEKGTFPGLFVV